MRSADARAAAEISVPGDKSIAHRTLIAGSLAPSPLRVSGLPDAADVRSTARALEIVGVGIDWPGGTDAATVTPAGDGWRSGKTVDCGNSGTTARLLIGLFAGLGLEVVVDGDASLRARPMDRVVYPLQAMGAKIEYLGEPERLPVRLAPRSTGRLRVLRYRSRIASAQVKSALVLAALAAGVEFEMWEPGRSRDHTERLLRHLGVPLEFGPDEKGPRVHIAAGARAKMTAADLIVPGDPSSAAFLLAAAILGGRTVGVGDLLLNATRTAYLETLEELGAEVEIEPAGERTGEPVGRVTAGPGEGPLAAVRAGPDGMPSLIDEIPVLAMLAARATGTSEIRGAGELRVKESDRLAALAAGLRDVGVEVEERPDGLLVEGRPDHSPVGAVRTFGDHRIAMAFGVLNEVPGADVSVDDPDCVAVSYPDFWRDLARLRGEGG